MQICVEVIYHIPEKVTLLHIALLRKSTAAGRGTPEEVEEGLAAGRVWPLIWCEGDLTISGRNP